MDLNDITEKLSEAYDESKEWAGILAKDRQRFFEAANEEIEGRETLARQTIEAPVGDGLDEYLARFHPGWRFVDETDDGRVIIEEDPAFKKFFYTNSDIALVFQRTVSKKRDELDDERLREEDPELWERITEPTRVLKDSEEWSSEDLSKISKYLVPGKIDVKLLPPRSPNEGEL